MSGETNMLLMSPGDTGAAHPNGVHHVDIENGKVVTEWQFEKDGTDITMRDIANNSKSSQLESSGSTFLGLDDSRLYRWDMRDAKGRVHMIGSSSGSPVLHWSQGHQFSGHLQRQEPSRPAAAELVRADTRVGRARSNGMTHPDRPVRRNPSGHQIWATDPSGRTTRGPRECPPVGRWGPYVSGTLITNICINI